MTQGFLVGYSLAITGILAIGLWRARMGKQPKKTTEPVSMFKKVIEDELAKKGITAKVHEIPSTPEEAIVVYAQAILLALKDSDTTRDAWLRSIRDKADVNKRDSDAIMQGTQALIKAVQEISKEKETTPGKSKEQFASYFAYARDHFKMTEPQKKVVDTIIKNLTA